MTRTLCSLKLHDKLLYNAIPFLKNIKDKLMLLETAIIIQ